MAVVPWGIPQGAAAAPASGHPDRALFATLTEHPFGQGRVRFSLPARQRWGVHLVQGASLLRAGIH